MLADRRGAGSSPWPRSATNACPDLISTTHPTSTSPIVGSPSSFAAATETHAASKPAIAGRVPSIGSTIRTSLGSPAGSTIPRSSE